MLPKTVHFIQGIKSRCNPPPWTVLIKARGQNRNKMIHITYANFITKCYQKNPVHFIQGTLKRSEETCNALIVGLANNFEAKIAWAIIWTIIQG